MWVNYKKSLKKNKGIKTSKFWIVVLSGQKEGHRKKLKDIGNFLFLKMDGWLVYEWSLYCWILNCKYTYTQLLYIYFIYSFISKKGKNRTKNPPHLLYYEAVSDPIMAHGLPRLHHAQSMRLFPLIMNNVHFIMISQLSSLQRESLSHRLSPLFCLNLIKDYTWHCNWEGFEQII